MVSAVRPLFSGGRSGRATADLSEMPRRGIERSENPIPLALYLVQMRENFRGGSALFWRFTR